MGLPIQSKYEKRYVSKVTCFSICWPSRVNTWMRMSRMWMWLGMSRRARLETMWKMSLLMPSVRWPLRVFSSTSTTGPSWAPLLAATVWSLSLIPHLQLARDILARRLAYLNTCCSLWKHMVVRINEISAMFFLSNLAWQGHVNAWKCWQLLRKMTTSWTKNSCNNG